MIETGRNTKRSTPAQLEPSAQALPRARQAQLVVREVGDELLVYDLTDHQVHALNRAAALVWRHCDGQTTTAQACHLLEAELETPYDESAVHLALDQLHQANLLEAAAEAPRALVSPSRRALLRRLGAAAVGGAVILPLVESINAPPAHAGVTPGPTCLQPGQTGCTGVGTGPTLCCGTNTTRTCVSGRCCVDDNQAGCGTTDSNCCGNSPTGSPNFTCNSDICCVALGDNCADNGNCCGAGRTCANNRCCVITQATGCTADNQCCPDTTGPTPAVIFCDSGQCCIIAGQSCNTSNQCCGEPNGRTACNNAKCCIKGGQPCPSNPALCCGGSCEGSVCKS